ncbi:hypothetical protein NVS55_28210 [Myxococcus stipitatus]|uniref:hypothetical protein n=1 Tax=Myxococcus stipitatus TaxID=83455 RepID=UPI0031451087
MVKRTVCPTKPSSVDSELTTLGRTLLEPVSTLALWAHHHRPESERARESFERAAR